jgi:hypothetical protein
MSAPANIPEPAAAFTTPAPGRLSDDAIEHLADLLIDVDSRIRSGGQPQKRATSEAAEQQATEGLA